jgi:adenosine deaminase
MTDESQTNYFVMNMPKLELHLHLEGAIPLTALMQLISKYGYTEDKLLTLEDLEAKFEYHDFHHFINVWKWKNQFLKEYEDFELISDAVAADLVSQNIRYAEVFFSPSDFNKWNLKPALIAESIRKGFDRHAGLITIFLITDLVRDFGPENGLSVLNQIVECRDLGILGIGIGGTEPAYPPELFEDVYRTARKMGFRLTAHAGEAAGAESILGAINILKVDRIGHGTRAYESDDLLNTLVKRQIPLEMCPISNVRTGVVDSLSNHPIQRYKELGIPISVNSDDPKMFNTSLKNEFLELIRTFQMKKDDIYQLQENAIQSAWCDSSLKKMLSNELLNYFEQNKFSHED